MEYYLATKGNTVLTHVAASRDLEQMMLSDRSQAQKTTAVGVHLCEECGLGRPRK